jgi:hypothetical protein
MDLNDAGICAKLAMFSLKQEAHHLGFMKHSLMEHHIKLLVLCQKRPKLESLLFEGFSMATYSDAVLVLIFML